MGTAGNVFNWFRDFLSDGSIQVRTGAELSSLKAVHHRGLWSVQLFFSIMINDVFSNIPEG